MLRSTVSFLIVTYLGSFLSFNHLSNCIFPCPLLFLAIYALHAGYLFVTDTLNTNYYGTTFGGVPGSFNSDQIECMCSQNRPRFKVPSERLSNEVQVPCLRGLRTDQQKSCFLLSPTVPPQLSANSVTMATAPPLWRLWQLHKALLPGIELGTLRLPVRRLNHSAICPLLEY